MKIAVLSDIHANIHALGAVWDDLETKKPDAVYYLGDLVGYAAFPDEVVSFIQDHGIPTVMGNYDEGIGFDLNDCGCVYRDPEQGVTQPDLRCSHTPSLFDILTLKDCL